MTSTVAICNMALNHCRAGSIVSLDEASNEAQQCKLFYETARKFVMENSPWKFTKKVAALALLSESPQEWSYSYAYPSDALAIRRLLSDIAVIGTGNTIIYRLDYYGHDYNFVRNNKIPYEVGTNTDGSMAIWTDENPAYCVYTLNQEDTTKFTAAFITALAHYLASQIAVPVSGRKEGRVIQSDQLSLYGATIDQAIANDQIEKYKGPPRESDMITVRNHGS